MNFAKESLLLYAVTDRSWLAGRSFDQAVEESLQGGVSFLQLREKTLNFQAFLTEALRLKALCAAYHVPFVINDAIEIALACDADGVHVGQSDLAVRQARAILGNHKIIGASVQTVEQAMIAEQQGADYLGVGAVFPTSTKQNAEGVSYDQLKAICQAVRIPVVAIGGIHQQNILQLSGSGIAGAAMISAIYAEKDIRTAAAQLKILCQKLRSDQSH